MFWFYEAVGAYLGRVLGVETQLVQSPYEPLKDPIATMYDTAIRAGYERFG